MSDQKIIVTCPFVGICHMQVCAPKESSDEELLAEANRQNPSGTSSGWVQIIRDGKLGPVTCADDPERTHYMLAC